MTTTNCVVSNCNCNHTIQDVMHGSGQRVFNKNQVQPNKYLVAVYGTLRRGCSNHRLLESSRFCGEFLVNGFDMYAVCGSFPGIVPGKGTVTTEVYEVDQNTLDSLDYLEGYRSDNANLNMYNRIQLSEYAFVDEPVYIYVWNETVSEETKIPGGDWKSR